MTGKKYAIMTTVSSTMLSFGIPLAEILAEKGNDPHIICNMTDAFLAKYSSTYRCIHLDIVRGFHPLNLIKTILVLKRLFDAEHYDIVQYGTENVAFCASIAAWLAKVPIRIYEHWGARYVGYSGLMRGVSKCIERTAAFFSTDIRQVSPMNMKMCIADHIYPKEKVKVLGQGGTVGVDFSLFDLNRKTEYREEVRNMYAIPSSATVFGFVGRIQSDKGVNELIAAFRSLYQENMSIYLLLVGAEDDANYVSCENLNWAKACRNVVFSGFVTDVYRYVSAFDIMVHPTYREGFGMVLQEAAAMKVPIITTDIMGPAEYIQDQKTGILVEPRSIDALKSAMLSLMRDPKKENDLAENGYRYTKEHFERSVMLQRILQDRDSLCEQRCVG